VKRFLRSTYKIQYCVIVLIFFCIFPTVVLENLTKKFTCQTWEMLASRCVRQHRRQMDRQTDRPMETFNATLTLTLTLIQPASMWRHWTTLRCHSCPSEATASASSHAGEPQSLQMFLDCAFQLVHGGPGPLLNFGTSQYNEAKACCGVRW